MDIAWQEWLSLIIRWLHIVTAIAWIGTSFYFIWLDQSLRKNPKLPDKVSGDSWSVHGGGFYHVEKYVVAPDQMPNQLHWFKFEAYFTWISGFALLAILYYWGAESFLLDPNRSTISPTAGILISICFLAGGWFAYDLLCRSVISKNTATLITAVFLLITLLGWGLTQLFNDRAALLHVGAVIGTIMSANVFFVIIPNQRKVVSDLMAERTPSIELGLQAKQRSLHNNYLTLPVILFMISGHYPILFNGGSERGWIVISLILVIGAIVRHFFNTSHAGKKGFSLAWQWPLVIFFGAVLILFLNPKKTNEQPTVTNERALSIIEKHCSSCHASKHNNSAFASAPAGVMLETIEQLLAHSARVRTHAVITQSMPLGNLTKMTAEERTELGAWISKNK